MEYVATMAENGRLVIPKEIRNAWGLKGGQQIIFREKKGKVELEPRMKKWRALQAIFSANKDPKIDYVEEFLEWRRKDSGEE